MSESIPVEIPLLGLNTLDPFIAFDSGYARELTNYALVNGRLRVRPGTTLDQGANTPTDINWFTRAANYPAITNAGDIVNLTSGAVTGSIGGACQCASTTVKHVSLELVIGCRAPRSTVAPFTAWTFTTGTITATAITSAVSHQGRLCVSDGSTIEYSTLGAITGAMAGVYTVSSYMQGQTVIRMFSVTAQPGNEANNVFVVFGSAGLVLVFSGDYPGSSNWQILGKFEMPTPVSNLGFHPIDGDVFVATSKYAYWFRDLFTGGAQTAYDNSPSRPIENLWQAVVWGGSFPAGQQEISYVIYFPEYDCLICQCFESDTDFGNLGDCWNYANEATWFVYFRRYKAWAIWATMPFFHPIINGYGNYRGTILTMDITAPNDTVNGTNKTKIETSWKTPFFYPKQGRSKQLLGTMPFFRHTTKGYMPVIRGIYDMSDYNAPWGFYTQSTVTAIPPGRFTEGSIDVPAVSWNIYKEFCGIGGDGAGFSIQYSMNNAPTDTTDIQMEIYNASVLFEGGREFPA